MNKLAIKEQDFWPDVDSIDLYQDLLQRYEHHRSVAEEGAQRAFRMGWWLALLIPIGAALLTLLVGFSATLPKYLLPACGFVLTVLAVVNSTLKPGEKYPGMNVMLVLLHDWKLDLDIRIKQLDSHDKERVFDLLREKNGELSGIGRDMAQRVIPRLMPALRKPESEARAVEEQIPKEFA